MWEDNGEEPRKILVQDIINKYSADYKVIFVGDATIAPVNARKESIEKGTELKNMKLQPLDVFAIISIG